MISIVRSVKNLLKLWWPLIRRQECALIAGIRSLYRGPLVLLAVTILQATTLPLYAQNEQGTVRHSISRAESTHRVPKHLLLSICEVESGLYIKAYKAQDGDGTASYGICQVKYQTAFWLGFRGLPFELLDSRLNADMAARYLKYQLTRYRGNEKLAIAAYNAGRVKRSGNRLINARYVQKVWKVYNAYRRSN
jgi:soluble lytic murein transglycosylase-like protein